MRERLKIIIDYLARNHYKDSISPRRAIARELRQELLDAGIPEEDHLIAVINMYPKAL